MKTILVLTHEKDDCATMVIKHLGANEQDVVRFNTEEFQQKIKCTLELDKNGKLAGAYHFQNRKLEFNEIGIVWNRRIHAPVIEQMPSCDPAVKEWAKDESFWGLNVSITLIPAPVVNPWEVNERLKFNKMLQMQRATEVGLEIPESVITNNPSSIKLFWEKTNHEMIFKKIRKGLFKMSNGQVLIVHTNRIPEEKFNEETIQRMRFCPVFLQKHIQKKYDIRAIVVGEKVFSVAIHSQNIADGVVDYRKAFLLGKLDEIKHEGIDLGQDINKKLVKFTKSFGLSFGAIDLIMTPDERIIFLEDNPNGQWAWLEHKTGVPISKATADYLSDLNSGKIIISGKEDN